MPTYAYACSACDHRFEVRQSFHDSALSECPQCTGQVRKLFNTVGIVFKGSGFYRTDSRSNGSAKNGSSAESAAAPSSTGASTESTATSTKPADAKPAAASSTATSGSAA